MERLVFIVEGDCELQFVEKKVIPYLYEYVPKGHEVLLWPQKITTNRKLNRSGGNVAFSYLQNEVKRVAAQGNPWITTFVDFFRLPTDFPGYSSDSSKINEIESAISNKIEYDRFIPYIQRHEFETLLFAVTDGFTFLGEKGKREINAISSNHPNVEDIDGGLSTAPSKRLEKIFNYSKVFHSQLVWKDVPLEQIMQRAPRFKAWIESLVAIVSEF